MRFDHPAEEAVSGLRQLWMQAFGDPEAFLDDFFDTAFLSQRCLCALDGEKVTAALYWFDCALDGRKIAYLYAVATEKAYRGRGLCKALMRETLARLRARGYSGAVLSPAESSLFSMYENMGFRETISLREFPMLAGGDPVALEAIDVEEFARLRREALPAGGVVQEGENLAFLSRYARFYKGNGCLLAANREEKHLFCMEFFGNDALIPGILTALGAETGSFRTPGAQKPFALYAALDSAPAPSYFGLIFD